MMGNRKRFLSIQTLSNSRFKSARASYKTIESEFAAIINRRCIPLREGKVCIIPCTGLFSRRKEALTALIALSYKKGLRDS